MRGDFIIYFTEITDKLPYPAKLRQKFISEHNKVIDYVVDNYKDTEMFRKSVVNALNLISTKVLAGDTVPEIDYTANKPFANLEKMSVSEYKKLLGKIYIDYNDVSWNLTVDTNSGRNKPSKPTSDEVMSDQGKKTRITDHITDTPKEYLYLRAPQYPRMDTSKLFMSDYVGNEHFYMHPSLPIIPEKQTDISCTTDVKMLTDKDLMKLFPNRLIRTRAEVMYQPYGDIPMDEDLGLLIPINGYSKEDIRENIIKYPHFYQLTRLYNDEEISFYKHIEIDGKLFPTLEVWDSLPDSKFIPKTAEFIKEYVIRKYLLDRDHGVKHNYPLRGTLEPYLTLFAPPDFYGEDPIELARSCVTARVSYLRSRNPYIERYNYVKQGILPPNTSNNCPFKQYCRQNQCKIICADLVEYEYLMERNGLLNNKSVLSFPTKCLQHASECLVASEGAYKVVISDNTSDTASCLTYAAICNHYRGNTLHCSVYHLNFMEYINRIQQSWSINGSDDDLDYINIFMDKAKVVIVSNIDFMQFKDFQAQTLLNLAHNRKLHGRSTIIVSPKLNSLVGSGPFFSRLKEVFGKEVIDK